MGWIVAIAIVLLLVLTFCGENSDDAYQRGYEDGLHDGWAQTCNDIARFSGSIESALKAQRIC